MVTQKIAWWTFFFAFRGGNWEEVPEQVAGGSVLIGN